MKINYILFIMLGIVFLPSYSMKTPPYMQEIKDEVRLRINNGVKEAKLDDPVVLSENNMPIPSSWLVINSDDESLDLLKQMLDAKMPIHESLLEFAIWQGSTETVQLLLDNGAFEKPSESIKCFQSPFEHLVFIESEDIAKEKAKMLLAGGVGVNMDSFGACGSHTILSYIIKHCKNEKVANTLAKLLVEHEADPTVKEWKYAGRRFGKTPIEIAEEKGYQELANYFKEIVDVRTNTNIN